MNTHDLRNAVLLPVDMQIGFDEPSWPPRWNDQADKRGLALLAAWRISGQPILHVRHDSIDPQSTLRPDKAGNAFRPGFEPVDGESVISKSVNSAFIGTDLDLRLKRLGASAVVVFGITTDQCVSTTIRTGANMGWSMILAADACDCFDLPGQDGEIIAAAHVHKVHVATLGFEFCQLASTDDLINAMKTVT